MTEQCKPQHPSMQRPLMACGHVGNARDGNTGEPCCPLCDGEKSRALAFELPSLEGRESRCYCGQVVPSNYNLPFFGYRGPGSEYAKTMCVCGFYHIAHVRELRPGEERIKCDHFTALEEQGGAKYDEHYCGHAGWD